MDSPSSSPVNELSSLRAQLQTLQSERVSLLSLASTLDEENVRLRSSLATSASTVSASAGGSGSADKNSVSFAAKKLRVKERRERGEMDDKQRHESAAAQELIDDLRYQIFYGQTKEITTSGSGAADREMTSLTSYESLMGMDMNMNINTKPCVDINVAPEMNSRMRWEQLSVEQRREALNEWLWNTDVMQHL